MTCTLTSIAPVVLVCLLIAAPLRGQTKETAAAPMTRKAGLRSIVVRCTSQVAASGAMPASRP